MGKKKESYKIVYKFNCPPVKCKYGEYWEKLERSKENDTMV